MRVSISPCSDFPMQWRMSISPCSGECPFPHAVESVHFPMQWFPHAVESVHFPMQWFPHSVESAHFPTQWRVPISPHSGECPFPNAVESAHFPTQWFPHAVDSAHFPTQWRVTALTCTASTPPYHGLTLLFLWHWFSLLSVELRVVHFWAPYIPKWKPGVQDLDFPFHQRTNILSYHLYPQFSFFNCAIFVFRVII